MSQPTRTPAATRVPLQRNDYARRAAAAWGQHTGREYAPYLARTAALTASAERHPPALDAEAAVAAAGRRGVATAGRHRGNRPRAGIARVVLAALCGLLTVAAVAGLIVVVPMYQQWRVDLVLGQQVAGLDRAADDGGVAQRLVQRLGADPKVTDVVAGVYYDPQGGPPVIVAAGKRVTRNPRALLLQAVAGVPTHEEPVDYHAGPLGGYVRCAAVIQEGFNGTYCFWADHGTIGLGVFPGRKMTDSAELFNRIRNQTTVR